jgi:hypothetical protein
MDEKPRIVAYKLVIDAASPETGSNDRPFGVIGVLDHKLLLLHC